MEVFMQNYAGNLFAVIGAVVAFIVTGAGSSKSVGVAGQAGAGVLSKDPDRFVSVMVLQALPSTQAIYGFVIAFLIIGNVIPGTALDYSSGLVLMLAGLQIGIVGYFSAFWQGRVAVSGINMIAKQPDGMGKAIVLALMVEMFAILSLIVSILLIGKV